MELWSEATAVCIKLLALACFPCIPKRREKFVYIVTFNVPLRFTLVRDWNTVNNFTNFYNFMLISNQFWRYVPISEHVPITQC